MEIAEDRRDRHAFMPNSRIPCSCRKSGDAWREFGRLIYGPHNEVRKSPDLELSRSRVRELGFRRRRS